MSSPTLDPFRAEYSRFCPPVIVFNKSHSGSRMLAQLLHTAGLSMGAHLNESWDSLDILELVEYLVTHYYPDYSPLWDLNRAPDTKLVTLIQQVFQRHLEGIKPAQHWGWKLCETAYILPVLDYCFPSAQFVHLIRDGRDVAFCDHKAPDSPFWRKVYFNTDLIRSYAGLSLTPANYRRQSYIYNALHWVNSVATGHYYGAMLRERYLVVRYEDLCKHFDASATWLLSTLGLKHSSVLQTNQFGANVRDTSVGKHLQFPEKWVRKVVAIEKPLLLQLGYMKTDTEPTSSDFWGLKHLDRFLDRRNRYLPVVTRWQSSRYR